MPSLAPFCTADDPDLVEWVKDPYPWVTSPPPGIKVNCFRDPFVLDKPSAKNGGYWRVMIGSAIELQPGDACCAVAKTCNCVTTGTAIVYRTKDLHKGEGLIDLGEERDWTWDWHISGASWQTYRGWLGGNYAALHAGAEVLHGGSMVDCEAEGLAASSCGSGGCITFCQQLL